jgi:DNA-binding SARP family transcriptional activator
MGHGKARRYRASLVRFVTAAAQAADKLQWPEEMVEICRRAFECEPLSDPLCRRLMKALAQARRGAEAGEVYLTFRTTLHALKQGEPSAATVELYKQILADQSRGQVQSSRSADVVEPKFLDGSSSAT